MPLPGLSTALMLATAALDPLTLSYAGNGQLSSDTTNPSIASVPIGTASANRWVVVVVGSNSLSDTISAVTIGGIAATIVVQKGSNDSSFGATVAIAIANVPTGTTATVAWTIGSSSNAHMVAAYALTGLQSSTATATANGSGNPISANINVSAGGCAIGGDATNIFATSNAWSGITKDVDATLAGAISFSSASQLFVAAQSPLAVVCTPNNGRPAAFVAASFR